MPDGTPLTYTLRNADDLVAARLVAPADRDEIAAVEARYAVAIPPALQALIRTPDDPIGLQFVPDPSELTTAPHERTDPIGDDALSPVKGIVHRYPDRALLKPLLVCPVYCRFCFRREHVGPGGGLLTEAELEAAYAWLRERPTIREVILTGGDPLMLSPRRLSAIIAALSAIPHIEILRIHSRVPVADPQRLTPELAAALHTEKAMWLVVHANHAREFTPAPAPRCAVCRRKPFPCWASRYCCAVSMTRHRRWRICSAPCWPRG
jgi:lysine 2,3-aminomutase